MEKYHIPWTCLPKLTWGLPTWSLTTNSSWLPWGGCRASDASTNYFYFRNKSITELDGETEETESKYFQLHIITEKLQQQQRHSFLAATFQDNPGKPAPECHHSGFYWNKTDGGERDNWSCKMCKVPVKSSPSTYRDPTFYRLDSLPFAKPAESENWREKVPVADSTDLLTPSSSLGFPALSRPLKAPDYTAR